MRASTIAVVLVAVTGCEAGPPQPETGIDWSWAFGRPADRGTVVLLIEDVAADGQGEGLEIESTGRLYAYSSRCMAGATAQIAQADVSALMERLDRAGLLALTEGGDACDGGGCAPRMTVHAMHDGEPTTVADPRARRKVIDIVRDRIPGDLCEKLRGR